MSWAHYNATIVEIREEFEVDLETAREFYSVLREEYGRPITPADVVEEAEALDYAERHPEEFEEREPTYVEPPSFVAPSDLVVDEPPEPDIWDELVADLDDRWFDDDLVDEEEELEFTVRYTED